MTKKAVLYVRVSDERQLEGYSPEVQEREGEKYAARQGFEVVRRWVVSESAKAAGREATQAEVARRLRISRSYLSEIEAGAKMPSLGLALRIERETAGAVPARSWATA